MLEFILIELSLWNKFVSELRMDNNVDYNVDIFQYFLNSLTKKVGCTVFYI